MSAQQGVYWRAFFLHNGDEGPWPCVFCNEEVKLFELQVHHLDEDHFNHDPSNLAACHSSCHSTHHHKGRRKKTLRHDSQTGVREVRRDTRRSYPSFYARYTCLICSYRFHVPGRFPTTGEAAKNREQFEAEHLLVAHEIAMEGRR